MSFYMTFSFQGCPAFALCRHSAAGYGSSQQEGTELVCGLALGSTKALPQSWAGDQVSHRPSLGPTQPYFKIILPKFFCGNLFKGSIFNSDEVS